jgi:hypothetical protein
MLEYFNFRPNEAGNKLTAVLVKVSSETVHNLAIKPTMTKRAFDTIQYGINRKELKKEIGSVLIVGIATEVGLVTVMTDLSKQGYRDLTPQKYSKRIIEVLWGGFRKLVETVLLPLAAMGVIHSDIRPGFDVTSNILCKLNKKRNKAAMKLIDYESLVMVNEWDAPNDCRYIGKCGKWDSTTFVWWQCVVVAYIWYEELTVHDIAQSDTIRVLQHELLDGSCNLGPWNEFRVCAKQRKINADGVRDTLDKLDAYFVIGEHKGRSAEGTDPSGHS